MSSKILENIMEITNLFCFYNLSGKFKECTGTVSYFDQMKNLIEEWAEEFEKTFEAALEESGSGTDYLQEIEAFAVKKFAEMDWVLEDNMEV